MIGEMMQQGYTQHGKVWYDYEPLELYETYKIR